MSNRKLTQLMAECYDTALQHGWESHCDSSTPEGRAKFSEKLMLVVSELSEALEELRKGSRLNQVAVGHDGKPEGIPIELADACIRIFDLCFANGIDLETALETKIRYNKTREWRHGGKLL